MTRDELLERYASGERDFRGALLSGAYLIDADLSDADLTDADLSYVNLSYASLTHVNLICANLSNVNLSKANLTGANLSYANLLFANLSGVDLTGADLICANLTKANLTGADLSGVDLTGADLSYADLSATAGLFSASSWLETFDSDEQGLIVYKGIRDTHHVLPPYWTIEPGAALTETCNPCRTSDCACGVNFGTREWCEKNYPEATLWRCRIAWRDLAGVVVPYHTDGNARCERLTLLQIVG